MVPKKIPRSRHKYEENITNTIIGYSDADWAGSYDRKSTT
jgi:hypothetical protein